MSDGISRNSAAETPAAWWFFGLLGVLLVLLSPGGESWTLALRYDRQAVLEGEVWRLITGHLVHGSVRHLLMNELGLLLVAALLARDYTLRGWIAIYLAGVLAIDVGFVFFEPQLEWYVGLSGASHGAVAAGAVASWRHENRLIAAAISVVLLGKLALEFRHGGSPFAGLPVVVEAHRYGAIGGACAGLGILFARPGWSFGPRSL
jgi:rhomboid family GlyGly-CTERM serine protease